MDRTVKALNLIVGSRASAAAMNLLRTY